MLICLNTMFLVSESKVYTERRFIQLLIIFDSLRKMTGCEGDAIGIVFGIESEHDGGSVEILVVCYERHVADGLTLHLNSFFQRI